MARRSRSGQCGWQVPARRARPAQHRRGRRRSAGRVAADHAGRGRRVAASWRPDRQARRDRRAPDARRHRPGHPRASPCGPLAFSSADLRRRTRSNCVGRTCTSGWPSRQQWFANAQPRGAAASDTATAGSRTIRAGPRNHSCKFAAGIAGSARTPGARRRTSGRPAPRRPRAGPARMSRSSTTRSAAAPTSIRPVSSRWFTYADPAVYAVRAVATSRACSA